MSKNQDKLRVIHVSKRNRTCSLCGKIIPAGEKHFSIPKGGYGNWNICANPCIVMIYDALTDKEKTC